MPGLNNITDSIQTWTTGGGFWEGMDELFLNGAVGNVLEYGFFEGIARSTNIGEFVSGIADRNKAADEQRAMDAKIEAANNEIVKFAVEMEAAGDDITSQLKTYQKMTAVSSDMVVGAARSQYSAIALISDATTKSNKITADAANRASEALGRLSKTGVMTSDSLMQIIDAAANVQETNTTAINSAVDAFNNGVKGTSNDGKTTKDVDLDALRKDLGLGADATINEIKEAYLKQNAKFGKDGNIQYDKNGNIKMKGVNKNRTAIYNALNDLSANLGDYADMTKDQLESLKAHKIEVDLPVAINKLLTSVDEQLGLTDNLTTEQMEQMRNDKEFQAKASAAIMEKGYQMIEEMTAKTGQYIKDEQARIEKMQEEYNAMADKGSVAAVEKLEAINAANSNLAPIMQNYNQSLQQLTDATLAAAGYMDAATGDEMLTRAASTRERINDIRDKIGSGDLLDAEDFAFIRDDLAPQMHDLFGDSFDLTTFYKDLEEGNSRAFSMLDDLYDKQSELTDMAYEKSIATFPKQLAELEKEYKELMEGKTDEEKAELQESYEFEKQLLEDLRDTQIAQQATAKKLNTEMLGLSADELRIQNARTKLEILQAKTSGDIVDNYHQQIEAQKILMED